MELKEWAEEFCYPPAAPILDYLRVYRVKMRRYLHLECSNDGEENEKFWRVDLNTLYFKTSSVDKLFNFGKII